MGTRFVKIKKEYYPYEQENKRIVYWSDGSLWREYEYSNDDPPPREVGEHEKWIVQAIQQFQILLSGNAKEFSIPFMNGEKFVGKIVENNESSPAGDYLCVVTFVDPERKPKEGWIHKFEPTDECPSITDFIRTKFQKESIEVADIVIKESKIAKRGKKWKGIYFEKKKHNQ